MTEERFYKIEQAFTTGWEVIAENLTKEECKVKLDEYLAEGISPDYLRVVPQQ